MTQEDPLDALLPRLKSVHHQLEEAKRSAEIAAYKNTQAAQSLETVASTLTAILQTALDARAPRTEPRQTSTLPARLAFDLYREGWTQEEIGKAFGVHQATVSRVIAKLSQERDRQQTQEPTPPPAPTDRVEQPSLPLNRTPRRQRPPIIMNGRALERCLCDAGFTPHDLAARLKIRPTAVQNWIACRNGMKRKHRAEVRRLILAARAEQNAREANA